MPSPTLSFETHRVIPAICPECQDAVTATPIKERGTGYEAQVQGLICDRCGYSILIRGYWVSRWIYEAER